MSVPVSGSGSFGSTGNTANDQLSATTAMLAGDLSVHVDAANSGNAASTKVQFSWKAVAQ